jgi:peptidoglycan/LPS O-acetylase OafA/YrhL
MENYVWITDLYKYTKSLVNGGHNLSGNTHVWSIIYEEFYYDIVYILPMKDVLF